MYRTHSTFNMVGGPTLCPCRAHSLHYITYAPCLMAEFNPVLQRVLEMSEAVDEDPSSSESDADSEVRSQPLIVQNTW